MATRSTNSQHEARSAGAREHELTQLPVGVGVGFAVGVILGMIMDSFALGIAIGLAIGCGWAVTAASLQRSHRHDGPPRRRFEDRH